MFIQYTTEHWKVLKIGAKTYTLGVNKQQNTMFVCTSRHADTHYIKIKRIAAHLV